MDRISSSLPEFSLCCQKNYPTFSTYLLPLYLLIRWKRIPHIYCTVTVTVGTSSLFYPDQIRSPDWVPGPSTYSELQRLQVERPSRGMFVYCLLGTSWALQHMMYCPDFVSFGHFSWWPTTTRRRRAWCLVTSGVPGGVLAEWLMNERSWISWSTKRSVQEMVECWK